MHVRQELAANDLTELLFEEPGAARCLVAPDGRVVRANTEWLRSTGFSNDEVLGRDAVELFPETREMALAMLSRARAGHRVEVPRHARCVAGREEWWEGSIAPVPMDGGTGLLITMRGVTAAGAPSADVPALGGRTGDEPPDADDGEAPLAAGRASRLAGTVRDFTHRQAAPEALRESEAKLRAVFNSLVEGVVFLNPRGEVEAVNDAVHRTHGHTLEELRDAETDPRAEIVRSDGTPFPVDEQPAMVALRTGEAVRDVEMGVLCSDGSVRWRLVNAQPAYDDDGRLLGAVASFFDITDRKLAEKAFRDGEERFRRVFDHAATGIAISVLGGRFLSCNPAFAALVGYEEDELCQLSFADLVHPDDLPATVEKTRRLNGTADPFFEEESRYLRKDGQPVWVHKYVCKLADTATPPLVMALVTDITERRRAEQALRESEERLRHTLAYASAGVWEWDPSGRLFSSPENYALYGLDPAETLDFARWEKCLHPDDAPRAMGALQDLLEGRAAEYRSEFRVLHPVVGTRWILGVGRLERGADGRARRLLGLNLDITDRKRAEEELRLADQRKTQFLGVLSHELRNPLAPIRNSIELLERSSPGSEHAARAKRVIRRQTEHLTRLIDDLLDVTRISRGKITLERERLDLREVVRKTLDDLHGLFEQAGVELRLECARLAPVWIDADGTRVSQIIGNLLQNSAKFTPRGGAVTVVLATSDGHAEMRVRDTGIGMDPATVEHMFEPFAQADQSLARTKGGLGLGLALVKGLVDLHGGAVEARSEGTGRGAEFIVRLPMAAPGAAAEVVRASPVPKALSVVIIEDNLDAAQTLADVLTLGGHDVRIARDGRSGIALVREARPEVVLCDIGLPDIDGYEVAETLRRDGGRAARLIALSGYAQPEDRQRARDAGFDAHIAKPPDLDELARVLTSV